MVRLPPKLSYQYRYETNPICLAPRLWVERGRQSVTGQMRGNSFVLTPKPGQFLELCNSTRQNTVASLSQERLGRWISCMPAEVDSRCTCEPSLTYIHVVIDFSYSSSPPTRLLYLTSPDPVWFHLSWLPALCSLLKMFPTPPLSLIRHHPPLCLSVPTPSFQNATIPFGSGDVASGLTLCCCHHPWAEVQRRGNVERDRRLSHVLFREHRWEGCSCRKPTETASENPWITNA